MQRRTQAAKKKLQIKIELLKNSVASMTYFTVNTKTLILCSHTENIRSIQYTIGINF